MAVRLASVRGGGVEDDAGWPAWRAAEDAELVEGDGAGRGRFEMMVLRAVEGMDGS
jgi:hypothetical protein